MDKAQVLVAKAAAFSRNFAWAADVDWDKLGTGCEAQLGITQAIIHNDAFRKSLDDVLNAAKSKLAKE